MDTISEEATASVAPLTSEQLKSFHRDGCLVVEDLISQEEVEGLRSRLRDYTHGGRPSDKLRIQTEPKVTRGELEIDHPGDGIRRSTVSSNTMTSFSDSV